ncbi:hypothetical protein QFZ22_002824 [Streptomyces canus]|uniref:DUF1453 domain-containing protein n=1 Tax=Streptomyces canus TaxID=58343 RepID=A0AAW8FAS0_9ACTN|nr:hypothetical protein [Streptomyces canus]MDQ0906839.1 hypothetical protein [Streptomyces canus]
MTISDWLIDVALLLVVLRQLREERLTLRTVLLPLALITWAGIAYLHDIPTAGNDLVLIGAFAGTGVALGLAAGSITRVRYADGHIRVKAALGAAALWVVGMGFRLGFGLVLPPLRWGPSPVSPPLTTSPVGRRGWLPWSSWPSGRSSSASA